MPTQKHTLPSVKMIPTRLLILTCTIAGAYADSRARTGELSNEDKFQVPVCLRWTELNAHERSCEQVEYAAVSFPSQDMHSDDVHVEQVMYGSVLVDDQMMSRDQTSKPPHIAGALEASSVYCSSRIMHALQALAQRPVVFVF